MSMPPVKIFTGTGLALLLAAAGWFWHAGNNSSSATESNALLQQGIVLFEQGQYSEVLAVLQKIPADEAGDWRVPYYIGSAYMMLKDYPLAAASLERALTLNPRESGVLYALGVSYYKLGQLGLAKAYFSAVLEINPQDQHARGLMDIMANLEQEQARSGSEESAGQDGGGKSSEGSSH